MRPRRRKQAMATVGREPPREDFQPPMQGSGRQVVRATSNRNVVPETVNVLGRSPGEGGAAVTLQVAGTVSVGPTCEKGALFIECLLVNLALDSGVDLVPQNCPIRVQLRHGKSFPECLAKAYQKLHRDVMLLKFTCRDRHFKSASCCCPSGSHVVFSLCQECDSAGTQAPRHGGRHGANGRPDEVAHKRFRDARVATQYPFVREP